MRILGITLPENKRIEVAMTSLYGIGRSLSRFILNQAKVNLDKKTKEISLDEESAIRKVIESLKIEGELKRDISYNIKRLKDIKAYRGTRHAKRLPARGQRTKTNSRTLRGNVRKTMGSGRRKEEKT